MSLIKWNYLHSWLMIICFLTSIFLGSLVPITIIPFFSFLFMILLQKKELKKMFPWGGYANYITGLRLLILMSMGVITFSDYILFVLGFISVLLDGVDGLVARKFKHESITGAIFDLEVDAIYVLIISIIISSRDLLPFWILLPALMRYIFIIVTNLFKMDLNKDKRTFLGPAVAGLHFVALLLPFIAPQKLFFTICSITSGLIAISFIYSFVLMNKKE